MRGDETTTEEERKKGEESRGVKEEISNESPDRWSNERNRGVDRDGEECRGVRMKRGDTRQRRSWRVRGAKEREKEEELEMEKARERPREGER